MCAAAQVSHLRHFSFYLKRQFAGSGGAVFAGHRAGCSAAVTRSMVEVKRSKRIRMAGSECKHELWSLSLAM